MKNIAFLLLLIPIFLYAQDITNIAVLDLEGRGLSLDESLTLSDKLRNELVNTHAFKVIERNKMNEILKEQGFQQTGCTTQECAIQVGQLIGVKRMIAGSIGKVGRTYLLSVRLIDVATGEILQTVEEQVKGEIDDMLSSGVGNVAKKLANVVTAKESGKIRTPENKTEQPALKFGSLRVESKPSGAQLSINDSVSGKTPFLNDRLAEGSYVIKIDSPGFIPINDSIFVKGEIATKKNYTLVHSQAWRDSVRAVASAIKARNDSLGEEKRSSYVPQKYSCAVEGAFVITIGKINTALQTFRWLN